MSGRLADRTGAGINPTRGPLLDLDLGVARKVVEVNCLAALSWVQKLHRASLLTDRSAVVNVASIGGLQPAPSIALYGASKAMLIHLTKELAVEPASGVRVNAVAPGTVKTRFARVLHEGHEAKAAAPYLLGRLGVPEDVAGAVTFLLSKEAAWITGRTLVIDGGVTRLGGAAHV